MTSRIPAFVNPASGSADLAREALASRAEFDMREIEPKALADTLAAEVRAGTPRVVVSGGDGTIGTAAQALMATATELAVLPGGTLNHFARDLGLSVECNEALDVAARGRSATTDVATVNGRVFLNTSSVGAYVHFVRTREHNEKWFGYRVASFIAALRLFARLPNVVVEVEVDGERRIYRTPIVFIGVGERELQVPVLGNRVKDGKRGLHVIVVRGRTRGRVLALALNAVARGVKTAAKSPELDSFIVDKCTLRRKTRGHVAVDGEIVKLDEVLEYAIQRDALRVVLP